MRNRNSKGQFIKSESGYILPKDKVLVLRTTYKDNTSHNSFKWPTSGYVEAPDFVKNRNCGNGLHGWLWGEGYHTLSLHIFNSQPKWLVVEVNKTDIIDLDGKVKFPYGNVIYCGNKVGATELIAKFAPIDTCVIGRKVIKKDPLPIYKDKCIVGSLGEVSVTKNGTAIAGADGKASTEFGIAIAGHIGTAIAGNRGIAIAGTDGIASAGNDGIIIISYYETCHFYPKRLVGHIGKDGLLPNVKYCVHNEKFVKV